MVESLVNRIFNTDKIVVTLNRFHFFHSTEINTTTMKIGIDMFQVPDYSHSEV